MEGIIYRVQPYQEHGRLLFVYSIEGKKTLLAQGSQKITHASRVLSQYLTKIQYKSSEKSFFTLQEGKILDDYQVIKSDYQKTKDASVMLEIIDHIITDREDHMTIYKELDGALQSEDVTLGMMSFATKVLKHLGFGLSLKPDGRTVIGVSIIKGGLIYRDEALVPDLDTKEALDLLKLTLKPYNALDRIDSDIQLSIRNFIYRYYQYHLQTTLKNLDG